MSSSDAQADSRLLRSKRTRNTSTPDDSARRQPPAKKRRSALRRDTFEPVNGSTVNELADQALSGTPANGSVTQPNQQHDAEVRALAFRGGKKNEKRIEKNVGLLTLSDTDFYTVSQLPALPDQIRDRPTTPYSCVISPEHDYILALTPTDALVWAYNASASSPTARELLSFKLPFPPASADDPLPLAAFTASSSNSEPGIVVVSPKWGKVVYWESLTSASSYVPNQPSTGVQGSIPGMFHGEVVQDLVSAEPAGFILTLASGRVAQLTLRDQVGRPGIGIQFMRKSAAATVRGGLFGSIRNVFAGDRRKGTAIARSGRTARAQREVIICSEDAELEFWSNNLLTGNTLSKTISVKEQILSAIESQGHKDDLIGSSQFKVVDFALSSSTPSQDLVRADVTTTNIMLLASLSSTERTSYYLIDIATVADDIQIRVVHPIRCYDVDNASTSTSRSRVCLGSASTTAFVLFDTAIVLLSLARISESPSSQLVSEKSALPLPFQECIRLQDNTIFRVISFASEPYENDPSCIVAVQGFGIMRIVSHLPHDEEVEVEDVVSNLDAKSRIEQNVFFARKNGNPLDLARSYRESYTAQESRKAILDISRDIVMSKSKHIPKSSSSISEHLENRARALRALIDFSLRTYPDCLDRSDRIMLLWGAEKIAAAQAMWKVQERIQATYPTKDDREMTFMNFTLSALAENRQKYPNASKGEVDHVRHWLIHSVNSINRFLVELQDVMHETPEYGYNDPNIICDYFLEGTELWTTAYNTGFRFREDNAAVYGLGNETYERGVLKSGYPDKLPPAWTSTEEQVKHGHQYVEDVCNFLSEWSGYAQPPQQSSILGKSRKGKQMPTDLNGEPYQAPAESSLTKLADRLSLQADLVNRVVLEDNIQQQNKVNEAQISHAQKERELQALRADLREITSNVILVIARYNRDGALALAEKTSDTDLLVQLNITHIKELYDKIRSSPQDDHRLMHKVREVQNHVETYFERFGRDWAYSHFSSLLKSAKLGTLMNEGQADGGKKQRFLSWFFTACMERQKSLGKLSWINNVVGEEEYSSAYKTLVDVASDQEHDIWSKESELCLAKLAGLAAQEAGDNTVNDSKILNIMYELDYVRIIKSLAFHVNAALYGAVDDEAAIQLAIERFIPKTLPTGKKSQQTRKQLSETLRKLVTNEVVSLSELVDALTLLDLGQLQTDELDADVDDLTGQEYSYALQAIDLASSQDASQQRKDALRLYVWRRLLIEDKWIEINDTAGKSDRQVKEAMQRTVLFTTLLDLYHRSQKDSIEVRIPSMEELLNHSTAEKDDDHAAFAEEVKQLKKFVEKARLADHLYALKQEARDAVRTFHDQQGEETANDVLQNGTADHGHA